MWVYVQATGQIFSPFANLIGIGYSGFGDNRNKPELQDQKHVGCIPCGLYEIGEEFNHDDLGPVVMRLKPYSENEMFGRSQFLMHGVSVDNPLTKENESILSSHECICQNRTARESVAKSTDKLLLVVK